MELLEGADLIWLRDFRSIDLEHQDYMLEVCGVPDETTANRIRAAVAATTPGSTFDVWFKDYGLEIGWVVEVWLPKLTHSVGASRR